MCTRIFKFGADFKNSRLLVRCIGRSNAGDLRNDVWIADVYRSRSFQAHLIPDPGIAIPYGLDPVPPRNILMGYIPRNLSVSALTAVGITHRIRWIYDHGQPVGTLL